MNKAFTKEDGGPEVEQLPDLPLSPHINYVTPWGLADLQARLATARSELARLRANRDFLEDTHPIAVAERDIRYLESRVKSAVVIDPAAQSADTVEFGAEVTVEDENGQRRVFRIVGEDEADPGKGCITAHSPLALALIGEQPGQMVDWDRPGGALELEIVAIRYPAGPD
ncbi:transcription elongation factor [Maritimibacter sp. 55A14]|uniref:GreA/GreB family elongation factor n=1 Tax=Maritimibacter sp. 55A14 TaxID=2174844 RepID=UPI000D61C1E8|nr:GreA/GreB family elongation factor [Maritimibacter sp. 55A14]PWE32129.1 transcription elongation factor [Maritimibacter sp. 55A14]